MAHPPLDRVNHAVTHARGDLTAVADAPMWTLAPDAAVALLEQLQALASQVAELTARTLNRIEEAAVPDQSGATSTPNWLAHHTRVTRREAHHQTRLAEALQKYDGIRIALAAGLLHLDQAEVIARALTELPADLDPGLVARAEAHLIAEAAHHDAKTLRILGRRLLEVIDPDLADAHEARLLQAEERAAAAATRLTLWEDGHGKVHGRFTLDALHGAMLKKALLAFAAPKHRAASGPLGERKPSPERLGHAFAEYIARYPARKLPRAGGLNATVVVLLDYESLIGGLKAARLDTGEKISASLARRLACEAGIIPAVLGGRSQVLDLGRTRRLHNDPQRIAKLIEQDGSCIVEGCDVPAGLAHLHHPLPWSQGGGTNRDGWLICPPHHARAHDPSYTHTQLPNGQVAFHRRE